jgi:aspartate/glutamate racemase
VPRGEYRRLIGDLAAEVLRPIILDCTEISLLITQQVSTVSPFDTVCIHAYNAAEETLVEA